MQQPRSIEYEIAVQRAAQAAIWGMPAVGIRDIVVGTRQGSRRRYRRYHLLLQAHGNLVTVS